MAQVLVRNLDAAVVEALRAKAELRGVSLEQQLREVLAAAARPTPVERVALADRIRARTGVVPQSDSTDLIRADRDER